MQWLLSRLSLDPPATRESGYGLLPPIQNNAPNAIELPAQTFYSLKWLEDRLYDELRKLENLGSKLEDEAMREAAVTSTFNMICPYLADNDANY